MMISTSSEQLAYSLKQWYNVKKSINQQQGTGGSISSSLTDSPTVIFTDDNDFGKNAILDKIPLDKNLNIPGEYILIRKSLLNNLLSDHRAIYNALHKMLPARVIEALNRGERVIPQEFESITIFFSDIIGFTQIAACVEPLHIVALLNQLYSVMDHCATYFPLFKIETIGDAYMIVGGMNGDEVSDSNHVSDIADFALLVQRACALVKSPSDGSPIRLRMGIHSGPVAAGVVGDLMPRYCLFGNTVNCANRMESTGEACHIQCSSETARLLAIKGNHIIEKRGIIDVKGLGNMETYWLKGFTNHHLQSAPFDIGEILNKCQEMLDTFQTSDIGSYPHFKDKQELIDIAKGALLNQCVNLNDISENRTASLLMSKPEQSNINSSYVSLLNLGTDISSDISISPAMVGLKVLIISDCYRIRLATLHLLNASFTIDSFLVSTDANEAITRLKFLRSSFDIVVVEKCMFSMLSDEKKRELLYLLHSRDRLLMMVVPDIMFDMEEVDDDFNCTPFPYPSPKQFKSLLLKSPDPYTVKICCQINVEPYIKHDTIFRIVMVESSGAVGKIMKKQLSVVLDEMGVPFNISIAMNASDALDKCNDKYEVDLIIVDNALPTEMRTDELLEFLRNQPKTESSLIIILSKSVLANTAELISSGADLIWPKPLPEKNELRKRLKRICKHCKFD